MKKTLSHLVLLLFIAVLSQSAVRAQSNNLRLVFIRHAEKPLHGDNLTCQGLNRSRMLPAVIVAKFGIPAFTFVPGLGLGDSTKHARMFQTVIPLAAKYNLTINSGHKQKDPQGLVADLLTRNGTVLISWEHSGIPAIIRALGISRDDLIWPDDDYDSIWIVTFAAGKPSFTKDKEGLKPSAECNF